MKSLILFLCGIALLSCKSKPINPLQYTESRIVFGHGGGFSGLEKTYALLENGALFELTKMGQEYIKLDKVPKEQVSQLLTNFNFLKFDELKLNEPGNTYKFIELNVNGSQNRIVWGNSKVDRNVSVMHEILMNLIKSK